MKIFTKNDYVNETKKKPNYIVVMILSFIIAGTYTSNFYEYQTLREDYNKAIVIYNTSQINRVERQATVPPVQDSDVTSNGAEVSQVEINGAEANKSLSTVEDRIRQVAQEAGFEDEQLLVDIAFCESTMNPQATSNSSTATGLFQYLQGTWTEGVQKTGNNWTLEDRTDVEKATRMAIYHISNGQLSKWNASSHCWNA